METRNGIFNCICHGLVCQNGYLEKKKKKSLTIRKENQILFVSIIFLHFFSYSCFISVKNIAFYFNTSIDLFMLIELICLFEALNKFTFLNDGMN
jgi:hypothetical protein